MKPAHSIGLTTASGALVPLAGVRIDATLTGPIAEIELTHRYVNAEAVPIEAVYLFPLPADAALSGVSVTIGNRVIQGRVEEREKAFEMYDDAIMAGDGAVLVDQERPDVFRASIGNLNPGQAVEVALRYAILVKQEGAALRVQIPTTVSPRYVPASATVGVVGETDDDILNPERRCTVPYGLTLTVNARTAGGFKVVESPSHPIRAEHRLDGVNVCLSRPDAPLDRDVVLLLEPNSPHQPLAYVGLDARGGRHVVVSFQPDAASLATAGAPSGVEVLFLLDCSGSMGGSSIEQAKRALALCIRTLGASDRFDIVRFGSSFDAMWGTARDFDEASLEAATAWMKDRHADLGGTEILAALQGLLGRPADPQRPRQIVLLTDGQVGNDDEVISLARKYASSARIFSFGIGDGVGEALVRGVARASRGEAELIGSGERIEPKVLRQFGRLRQPALSNLSLDFGGAQVQLSPSAIPPVFAGDRMVVMGRLDGGHTTQATLRAGAGAWTVAIDCERPERTGAIAALWGRARLQELEDAGEVRRGSAQPRAAQRDASAGKRAALALALEYQLASSTTSWVLVETRAAADKTTAPAELRRVPLALTSGWGEGAKGEHLRSHRSLRADPSDPAHQLTRASRVTGSFAAPPMPSATPAMPKSAKRPMPSALAGGPPVSAGPGSLAKGGFVARALGAIRESFGGAGASDDGFGGGAPPKHPTLDAMMAESEPELLTPHDSADLLYDVLLAQRANGAFGDSPQVRLALGEAFDRLTHAGGGPVRLTQAVLFWLEARFSAQRDQWKGAADKAAQFLDSEVRFSSEIIAAWFGP